MYWTVERHRVSGNQLELNVAILVNDLCTYNITDTESWGAKFKDELPRLKSRTCYKAEYSYKAKIIDLKVIEIWKMKANSDFNYKMFTLKLNENYKPKFNPNFPF